MKQYIKHDWDCYLTQFFVIREGWKQDGDFIRVVDYDVRTKTDEVSEYREAINYFEGVHDYLVGYSGNFDDFKRICDIYGNLNTHFVMEKYKIKGKDKALRNKT